MYREIFQEFRPFSRTFILGKELVIEMIRIDFKIGFF